MEKDTLIHKYFENTLSPEERDFFDKLIKEDSDFQEQLKFEKDVKKVIDDKERLILKSKLKEFETQLPKPKSRKNDLNKFLRIAASIAVLIAAAWYFYATSFSVSPEELYASNYEIYPNTVYSITRSDTNDTSLERRAFEAYESNELSIAISHFNELSEKSGLDYIDFYLAQAYLADGQLQSALNLFEKIINEQSDFKTEALWYASLCKLKLNQPKEAIPLLNKLIQIGVYNKEAAVSLLKKIN